MVFALASCEIPNLDPPECSPARTAVREFYSFHFGNDMKFSPDTLKLREKFLTSDLVKTLSVAPEGTDPFTTGTDDTPKTFRAAECRVISPGRAEFDVLLFWRDDTRTEQRTIRIQAAKVGENWLVDRIER